MIVNLVMIQDMARLYCDHWQDIISSGNNVTWVTNKCNPAGNIPVPWEYRAKKNPEIPGHDLIDFPDHEWDYQSNRDEQVACMESTASN